MNFLKKHFGLGKYIIYNIEYTDSNEFLDAIRKILNSLKLEYIVIQIFVKDPLNSALLNMKSKFVKINNFMFYEFNNLDFVNYIDFNNLRFMNIYLSRNNNFDKIVNVKSLYSILISLDNYFETTELIVNKSNCDDGILKRIKEITKL